MVLTMHCATEGDRVRMALSTRPWRRAASRVYHPGPRFRAAGSLAEVVSAWEVVYRVYGDAGLIDPNPYRIHTVPHAVGPQAAVILDVLQSMIVSTVTVMRDTDAGLPLDIIFRDEIDALRAGGRQITEAGLYVDRRDAGMQAADSVLSLVNFVLTWSFARGGTDLIIGVHPRHEVFYEDFYGFERLGPERPFPVVNNHRCVLLRLAREQMDQPAGRRPRGLRFYQLAPPPMSFFEDRTDFHEDSEARDTIDAYLAWRESRAAESD